jgi:tetratricopeptide (TPR) repeat protein
MKEATAASLGYLGRLAQYQGRPGAALASYAEALKLLQELGDQRGRAEFTLAQAEALLELGMTEAAGERLKAAEELLRTGNNREQQAELLRLRGEELLARGERAAAGVALRRAVSAATASHGVVEQLAARLSAAAGGTGTGKGGAGAPLAGLERLRMEADALGNARLRLRAAELVAAAALAAGEPGKAQAAARAGLQQAAACGGYAGAYRLHGLLARALERGGPDAGTARAAEARTERRRAAEEIARVNRELGPEQRKSFDLRVEVEDGLEPGGEDGAKSRELGRHG